MKKKKSMQRESGNLSTNSHHPKKTVNVNIVVEGDDQSNENSLSQKQDIRYQQPIQQPKIDLSNTQAIKTSDNSSVFQQGVILRKVSKFVTGTSEDAMVPIPVFFEPNTGKILTQYFTEYSKKYFGC